MIVGYKFSSKIWEYSGQGSWFFVTLPKKHAKEIKQINAPYKKGFGTIKVIASIGTVSWETSIFPDSKAESYLLPIKKSIRDTCKIENNDIIEVRVMLKQGEY